MLEEAKEQNPQRSSAYSTQRHRSKHSDGSRLACCWQRVQKCVWTSTRNKCAHSIFLARRWRLAHGQAATVLRRTEPKSVATSGKALKSTRRQPKRIPAAPPTPSNLYLIETHASRASRASQEREVHLSNPPLLTVKVDRLFSRLVSMIG